LTRLTITLEEEVQATRSSSLLQAHFALLVLLAVLWSASCNSAPPAAQADALTLTVLPQVIEVTRVVERVVTATPAPTPTACVRTSLAEAREVVIGAIIPLSRPGAVLTGFAMQAAFNLAVEDLNAAGGVHNVAVRLITYDTASSAELSARATERLITLDCAAVIVGGHHQQVALAAKEVAHRHGVPLIISSATADEITSLHVPEIFRISPAWTMITGMPGEWLSEVGDYNHDHHQLAVIVADNNAETAAYTNGTREGLAKAGFQVESIAVELPATDFSPVIARIVALDHVPDAVLITVMGEAALQMQQQMLLAGIGPQQRTLIIANSGALNDQLFWQQVPNGLYTVVPRVGPWPSTVTAMGQEFADKYRQYFDRWPENQAFAAYDAVRLAADAIGRANSLSSEAIIRALEESDVTLASGHYRFPYGMDSPPDGVTAPAFWWHQWMDAPLLYLQYTEVGQPASGAAVIWPATYGTTDEPVLSQPANQQ
jgi:branched-chain amino acid transport system substrate-binding protein